MSQRAIEHLRRALIEQPRFIKLHAAEALLEAGHGKDIPAVYDDELRRFGGVPLHRIGIWRVLARVAPSEAARSVYVRMLCDVFLNPGSPDPVHAVESLSKLNYQIDATQRCAFEQAANRLPPSGLPNAMWLLALSGAGSDLERLADLLDADDSMVRGVTAYALRYLRDRLPKPIVERINTVCAKEPEGLSRTYLISAVYVTSTDPNRINWYRELLLPYASAGDSDQKYEVASALSVRGNEHDLPVLANLLEDIDPDVRTAAANAILKITTL